MNAEPAAGERMPLAAFPVVDQVGAEADLAHAVVGIADVEALVEERDAGPDAQARREVVLEEAAHDRREIEIVLGRREEAGLGAGRHRSLRGHA